MTPPTPTPVTAAVTIPDSEAPIQRIENIKLSPKEVKQWQDTMSMMAWTAPGFRHILYKLLNKDGHEHVALMNKECNIAATDGHNVMINPERFFGEFSLPERVYVLGHEIIHNVYGDVELLHRCNKSGRVPMHDGSNIQFDNDVMQRAMDYRINALLDESRIGSQPKIGNFDKEIKANDSVLDVYKSTYVKKYGDTGDHVPNGGGGGPGGFDNLMPPGAGSGQNPSQAAGGRNPQQWAVEIAAAQTIEQIRTQGRMAGALKRMFQTILEPEIDWTDHIQTLINRVCGDGGYDWTTPDPWMAALDIFSPSPTGRGAGHIVCWGDTSGSRSDGELASNMAELAGILADVQPARLTILWCDAAVDFIDEIQDPMDLEHIKARGTGGGGGTSLEPVMEWIAQQDAEPDLFIGFTDGYVSFPEREPRFPVIWASSTDHRYPFGQAVRVNKRVVTP